MATYSQFSIRNFRAFLDEPQTLHFGIPIEDSIGSGITYIVGVNNSGKTTLIEALAKKGEDTIRSSEKQLNGNLEFILRDFDSKVCRVVKLIRPEAHRLEEDPKLPEDHFFEIISSRRHWSSQASNSYTLNQGLRRSGLGYKRNEQNIETASILRGIEIDIDQYELFIEMVKSVVPEFSKFATGYEDFEYIEYISESGTRHKSDFLGDGVISAIRIIAHLFHNTDKLLIIDEPELSLHPLAQKRLIKLIAEVSTRRQIVISTHSPYFVEWEYIKNGAKLNCIRKDDDKECKIFTLKPFEHYKKLVNAANWQQPFLMDVVSKEIFFQENILFLEGQEDVGLLSNEFEDAEINIFGYGVRGYSGFDFALQLASDLGIKKAAVIMDSPVDPEAHPNENDTKKVLEEKYSEQGYKILQWQKNDIRDKEPGEIKEKSGYFNSDGTLKDEKELDDFYEKVNELEAYFSEDDNDDEIHTSIAE